MDGNINSLSINIIRDFNKELDYIPTPNSNRVYIEVINCLFTGSHAINIVGSFGTGKSSFIMAFERHINSKKAFFSAVNGHQLGVKGFDFFPIIGDYVSIIDAFCKHFNISRDEEFTLDNLINYVDKLYRKNKKKNKGLIIAIDEFGKFLEYAAKNNPEQELYFVQRLSEYVSDLDRDILLITTLHQNFTAYSYSLSHSQQLEWDKVKGRLKEITFNEPVEQLLYLAAEKLNRSNFPDRFENEDSSIVLFDLIKNSNVFPLKDYFSLDYARKLYPFDILSAAIMTLCLQRYGQNERSLFSFLESKDYLGLKDFDSLKNPFYNLSCTYDYLIHNYYSFLSTKYNPHYSQWARIKTALERAEGLMGDKYYSASKIIKSLGLLNIFAPASAILDKDFYSKYGVYSLGVENSNEIIEKLISLKIIAFSNFNNRFRFIEGTDLDIEAALIEASIQVDKITNIAPFINKSFDFNYIQAKEISYGTGTPRFFKFKITDSPIQRYEDQVSDGIINLIFSDTLKERDVETISKGTNDSILFGYFKNVSEIRTVLFDIEKIKKIKADNLNDIAATRELDIILQQNKDQLYHLIFDGIYSDNSEVLWYYNGIKQPIRNHKSFNQVLSIICKEIYFKTPHFRCELINKTRLSSAIQTAKKVLLRNLVEFNNQELLGFNPNNFPPEKTIYLSLLERTGIHRGINFAPSPGDFINTTFTDLWNEGLIFIEKSKISRLNLSQFVDILRMKPYKLKNGFIEFWLPIFLFINKDDFALFNEDGYITEIDYKILDLLSKFPRRFEIKGFDVSGVKLELFNKYRTLLSQEKSEKPTNIKFIELISPFLKFYIGLPEYSKKTKLISKKAVALREAIALSKDPEKSFFEDFPNALGFDISQLIKDNKKIEKYVFQLQSSIQEIRRAYDGLIDRIEQFFINEIIGEKQEFQTYKNSLQRRYKSIKKHLLLPKQKSFHQRLISDIDDRNAWINSLAQAALGKSLNIINDEEELILYENFKDIFSELDNLCQLGDLEVDEEIEAVINLEMTTFLKGLQKHLIRIPKNKLEEIEVMGNEFRKQLKGNDKNFNIALLVKILQEQLSNEE